MFGFLKNHKIEVFFAILAVIIAIIVFVFRIDLIAIKNTEENQIIFFIGVSLENWCFIITILGAFIGIPWALSQYNSNKREKQQEKAYDIATKFAEELMARLDIILTILFKNDKYMKLITKINMEKLKSFSEYEILELTNDNHLIDKALVILNSEEIQKEYKNYIASNYEEEQNEYPKLFFSCVIDTLNSLEAICINISSQAAGSQYIYQSLHQEFLKIVHILSPVISKNNINNYDKFYTNIISVYNMWQKQKIKDRKKYNKTMKKIYQLEEKSKKEINKLLNKEPDKV